MMRRLASYLVDRTPRERMLLGATALLVLPAVWFFWLAPLDEARERARAALLDARDMQSWVVARDVDFREAGFDALQQATEPVGIAGVERALRDSGLRGPVRRLEDGEDGRIALAFDAVSFVELAGFAGGVAGLGYVIDELRIEETDTPGQVTASLSLMRLPRGR
jgi:type II secretory pathway component PulM